jgi:hypothetical protein
VFIPGPTNAEALRFAAFVYIVQQTRMPLPHPRHENVKPYTALQKHNRTNQKKDNLL